MKIVKSYINEIISNKKPYISDIQSNDRKVKPRLIHHNGKNNDLLWTATDEV